MDLDQYLEKMITNTIVIWIRVKTYLLGRVLCSAIRVFCTENTYFYLNQGLLTRPNGQSS